jgi:hypothetical protein
MLADVEGGDLSEAQLHTILALNALQGHNDEDAIQHRENAVGAATGEERATLEELLDHLKAGHAHDAQHELEHLLGEEPHGLLTIAQRTRVRAEMEVEGWNRQREPTSNSTAAGGLARGRSWSSLALNPDDFRIGRHPGQRLPTLPRFWSPGGSLLSHDRSQLLHVGG